MRRRGGGAGATESLGSAEELEAFADEWNPLAVSSGSPFVTAEWLSAWWRAFGPGTSCLLLRDDHGRLRAGACYRRLPGGRIHAAADVHSSEWDVVAADSEAGEAMWAELAGLGAGYLRLKGLRDTPSCAGRARRVLERDGYEVAEIDATPGPCLDLPDSWDQLAASVSRNLRSQLGRRRRGLEQRGELTLRTTPGGPRLDEDLDAFLRLEGSGWKARSGTAIVSDGRTARLYREFARGAAAAGWLRLYLLELDGTAIAADFDCRFAGGTFLLKTGFDEAMGQLSPGLVLRGDVLRASIEEGSRFFDFLGGPDSYKVRWGGGTRKRVTLAAYRGPWKSVVVYRRRLRPILKAGRDAALRLKRPALNARPTDAGP